MVTIGFIDTLLRIVGTFTVYTVIYIGFTKFSRESFRADALV